MKEFCKFTTESPAASYIPLPRFLFRDETLRDITNDAKVLYDGRIWLEFGPPTAFEEKLRFFLELLKEGNLTESDSGTLDLSLAASTDHAYFSTGIASSAVSTDASSAAASTPESSSGL